MRDLKSAIRQLRTTPGITAVAILSLALGVGANTAIFSLVNAILLKGLPVHEPERLVELNDSLTNPIWEVLRDRQDAFAGVLAYSNTAFNLARRGAARPARGLYLSGGAFDVLGVKPARGRLFGVAEDARDGGPAGPTAVLSHGFWQREYGASEAVLGQTIWLDSKPFTIIGITPRQFAGLTVGVEFDVAVPINTSAVTRGQESLLDARSAWWLFLMGRLRPGQTIEDATARLRAVQPQIREATMPSDWRPSDLAHYLEEPFTLQATGQFSGVRRRYTQPLTVLLGIVGLVLLIACANLANLLLARGAARRRELAVRLSMGATRVQLIRQLLVESLLLASVSALAGFVVAQAGSRLLVQMISTRTSTVVLDLQPDGRVLSFSLAVTVVTALLFGLAPALRATALAPADALRGGRTVVGATRRFGLGQTLVGVQVALSLILVLAAALFVRSFIGLSSQALGFDEQRVLSAELDFGHLNLDGAQETARLAQTIERLQSVPGVTAAAGAFVTPVSGMAWMTAVIVPDYVPTSERDARSFFNGITPKYFATLGVPIVAGRDFTLQDTLTTPRVAIVSEAFVRKFMPGRNPVGLSFQTRNGNQLTDVEIVGLAGDAKYRFLREDVAPTVYVPLQQQTLSGFNMTAYLRTNLDPASLTSAATAAIADVHPDIVVRFQTLSEIVDGAMQTERVIATLSAFFGVLALLLAMIGLYGVMSYAVTRRRSEIGLRLALGAAPARVLRMVMRDVGIVTVAGLAVGTAVALATGKLVASLLFALSPDDGVTVALAIIVLSLAAAVAGYLPARRAARIAPMAALRDE